MKSMGYTKFKDIDCIFYEENDAIHLIPAKQTDKIVKYVNERDLTFSYNRNIHKCTAFIKRIEMSFDNSIRLILKYIFETIGEFDSIHGFTIVGDVLDDFFNPVNYFLTKHHNGEAVNNVVYGRENVDYWKIKFEEKNITISLSYGEILNKGRRSDLMLHPKLSVNFENNTNDFDFIYRAYKLVVKFIQIVRYDLDIGWYSMFLIDEKGYECGKFYELDSLYTKHCVAHQIELNYSNYKPYIGRILQFIANNQNLSVDHLPRSELRINMEDYDPLTFISIFGAFETECRANKGLYGKVDISPIKSIRKEVLKEIQRLKKLKRTNEEKNYLEKVISRIGTIDTNVGLKNKIVNSYKALLGAIESSLPNIFYLFGDEAKATFNIEKIAEELSELRGAVVHGDFNNKFSTEESREIYFLEIMSYAQMLKRALLQDKEIELILGIIFNCNISYLHVME